MFDIRTSYATAIENLFQARMLLVRSKSLMEFNKRQLEYGRPVSWDPTDQKVLDAVAKFLAAGLYGNNTSPQEQE